MSRLIVIGALSLAALGGRAEAASCEQAVALAETGEPARSFALLEACLEESPDDEAARRAQRAVRARLEEGDFGHLTVATLPEGGSVEIESLGVALRSPATVWLPFGEHRLRATLAGHQPSEHTVAIDARVRTSVILELAARAGPGAGELDFGVEEEPTHTAADPEGPEHENLLPDRFGSGPSGETAREAPRASRWPYVAAALGLAAIGGGVALHLSDRDRLGTGLLVVGGATATVGGAAIVLEW